MAKSVILEFVGSDEVRLIVFAKNSKGHKYVEDIIYTEPEHYEQLWEALEERHPDATLVGDDFEDTGELTVREAAEAAAAATALKEEEAAAAATAREAVKYVEVDAKTFAELKDHMIALHSELVTALTNGSDEYVVVFDFEGKRDVGIAYFDENGDFGIKRQDPRIKG